MSRERRAFQRESIVARAHITRDERSALIWTRNVSIGGVSLAIDPKKTMLSARDAVELIITLPGDSLADSVRARGRVIRLDEGGRGRQPGIGILFEQLDPDNAARLRTLILRASRQGDV